MGWFASTHFKLGAILLTSYPAHSAGDALGEACILAGVLRQSTTARTRSKSEVRNCLKTKTHAVCIRSEVLYRIEATDTHLLPVCHVMPL